MTFLFDLKTPLQRNYRREMVRYEFMYLLSRMFTAFFHYSNLYRKKSEIQQFRNLM